MLTEVDKKLVESIINRDESALNTFYRAHKNPLLSFIQRSLKDRLEAEEVLQDSFFSFIESLRDFRGQSSLKTFLYSIAKNKTIDKLRKKRIKQMFFSHLPTQFVESIAAIFLDDEMDRKVVAQKIESVFKKLPHDYVTVLRLKYTEGYKVAEIAERIKLSFKATESLIFRARKAFVIAYHAYERHDVSGFKEKTQRSIRHITE